MDCELKTSKSSVDIRPQLLLAARIATITLQLLNKEKIEQHKSRVEGKTSRRRRLNLFQLQQCELKQNGMTCKHMFGIKNELALRINISLLRLAVATGDLTCMGTANVVEAVIVAVHTLLNKLTKWLNITDGACGIFFAQTQLSLYQCICLEDELVNQLKECEEHSDRLALAFEMVREIQPLAEQVLRNLSARFVLARMLLERLSSRNEQLTHSVENHDSSNHPLKRKHRVPGATKTCSNEDGGDCERDDITEIISLYNQSCKSISSYAGSIKKTRAVVAANVDTNFLQSHEVNVAIVADATDVEVSPLVQHSVNFADSTSYDCLAAAMQVEDSKRLKTGA